MHQSDPYRNCEFSEVHLTETKIPPAFSPSHGRRSTLWRAEGSHQGATPRTPTLHVMLCACESFPLLRRPANRRVARTTPGRGDAAWSCRARSTTHHSRAPCCQPRGTLWTPSAWQAQPRHRPGGWYDCVPRKQSENPKSRDAGMARAGGQGVRVQVGEAGRTPLTGKRPSGDMRPGAVQRGRPWKV